MRSLIHPIKAVSDTISVVRNAVQASREYRHYGEKPQQGFGF